MVARCCEMQKLWLAKFVNFVHVSLRVEIFSTFEPKMVAISARNTEIG